MKKLLAIVLTAVLVLSVTAISAAAETGGAAKYGTDVAARLNGMDDDDKADFIVQFNQSAFPTDEEINEATAKKTDIDPTHFTSAQQVREYFDIRCEVRDELRRTAALSLMDKMGVTFDDVKVVEHHLYTPENVGRNGMPYAYTLTKAQVEKVIAADEVTLVSILYPTGELIMEPNEKISPSLMKRIVSMNKDDKVGVWVWQYGIDDSVATRRVFDAFGGADLGDESFYRAAKTAVLSDYYGGSNRDLVDALGIGEEDRLFISSLTPSFIICATAEQVWEMAYSNRIYSIDLYELGFHVPEGVEVKDKDDPLFDRFMSWGVEKFGREEMPVCGFEVLYTSPEWSLINAPVGYPPPWEMKCGGVVSNRFVYSIGGNDFRVSTSGYVIYDSEKDDFFSITQINAEDYPGLMETLETLNIGIRMGDADMDGAITVYDATRIQRIIADLDDPADLLVNEDSTRYDRDILGDYDGDGTMTVLDATAIQRSIAGLE